MKTEQRLYLAIMMNSDHHIHHLDNTQMRNLKRAGPLNCLTGNMILLLPIENPGQLAQETSTEALKNTKRMGSLPEL